MGNVMSRLGALLNKVKEQRLQRKLGGARCRNRSTMVRQCKKIKKKREKRIGLAHKYYRMIRVLLICSNGWWVTIPALEKLHGSEVGQNVADHLLISSDAKRGTELNNRQVDLAV